MKVLITGGSGFIGSHIVEQLKRENYDLIIVDRNKSKQTYFEQQQIPYYAYDIHDKNLEYVFKQEKPDAIIHLAAQISVPLSMKDPVLDMKVNGYGTIKLLKLATKYHVKKFIFASSAAVYGTPNYIPMDETHPVAPISFYGLSKAVGEQYIQMFQNIHDIDCCILRFANVYGPGQSVKGEAGVIAIFNHLMKQKLPLTIYGDGEQTRDFIYVKDIASACVASLQLTGSHTINISSDTACSLNELIQHFIHLFNYSAVTKYLPANLGDIEHSRMTNNRARTLLNWQPKYSMKLGLSEMYRYSTLTN